MLAFRQLAHLVAQEFGIYRMMILYVLSGIIGFGVSYLAGITLTIGASAAVCGLIGATLFYGISRGGTYGQAIVRQVGGWAIGLFLFGFLVPGINNWGHGGGICAGAGLALILGYQERKKENLLHKVLAAVCMILSLAVLVWAVASTIYYQIPG
jgi:rhomboid protease GluP